MSKILIGLVVVVAALAIARQEHLFEKWGVSGSCVAVRAPNGDRGAWYKCREGLLTGYPSLIGDQCTYELRAKSFEYWRCPVRLTRFTREAWTRVRSRASVREAPSGLEPLYEALQASA